MLTRTVEKRSFFIGCLLLIFAIAVGASYYGWSRIHQKSDPCKSGKFTILSLGDSITVAGYLEVLKGLLEENGFKNLCLKKLGRSGNTSGEYLSYLATHPDVLKGRVDLVLLQLGTNDVRIDHDHTDTQTFEANMLKIVGMIRRLHPKVRVFIATIPPILKKTPGYFDWTSLRRVTTEINPFISRLARKLGCVRVDVYRAFQGHPEYFEEDGIHPNQKGTKKLAEVYLQAILPALSRIFGVIHFTLPPNFHEKVVFQSDVDGDTELYLLTKNGVKKLTDNTYPDNYPVFSPDGNHILYTSKPGNVWKICLYSFKKKTSSIVVDLGDKNAFYQSWCPDGKHIVFTTDMWGKWELALYSLVTKKVTRLTDTMGRNTLGNCSPDGKTIVFTGNRGLGWHIYKMDLTTKYIVKFTHTGGNCRPHISPDGRWIAFVSIRGWKAKSDIFLMRMDGTEKHSLTCDPSHWEYYPAWSRDGKRIYFSKSLKHDGAPWHLWVINLDGSNSFQITSGFSKDRFADVY